MRNRKAGASPAPGIPASMLCDGWTGEHLNPLSLLRSLHTSQRQVFFYPQRLLLVSPKIHPLLPWLPSYKVSSRTETMFDFVKIT